MKQVELIQANDEEADISIALHDANIDDDCVVVSNDTVLFLFFICACYKRNPKQLWCMKYDNEKEQKFKKKKNYNQEITFQRTD